MERRPPAHRNSFCRRAADGNPLPDYFCIPILAGTAVDIFYRGLPVKSGRCAAAAVQSKAKRAWTVIKLTDALIVLSLMAAILLFWLTGTVSSGKGWRSCKDVSQCSAAAGIGLHYRWFYRYIVAAGTAAVLARRGIGLEGAVHRLRGRCFGSGRALRLFPHV